MKSLHVTVFGSAQPKPGDSIYEQGLKLGNLIGAQGWTVLTGGYIGTMEAVSRGASEAGGHVIGITCADVEVYRPVKANSWVAEEIKYPTLRERLLALIDKCDAAVALPGGIGTFTEVFMTWNQLLIHTISPRPLILIGNSWKNIVTALFLEMDELIPANQRTWVQFASDHTEAVSMLQEFTRSGKV